MGCITSKAVTSGHNPAYEVNDPMGSGRDDQASSSQGQASEFHDAVARVYHDSRLWHGTSGSYLEKLRSKGFSGGRRSGAVEATLRAGYELNPTVVEAAGKHSYFTSHPVIAKRYARRADPKNPALVRTIGLKNDFPLELDPDSIGPDGEISNYNCRTASSVPSMFVVGSKRSAPKDDAKVFKREMREAGYNVSLEEAGRLLREVQSDSDDDFMT